jgi:hypothetical protein
VEAILILLAIIAVTAAIPASIIFVVVKLTERDRDLDGQLDHRGESSRFGFGSQEVRIVFPLAIFGSLLMLVADFSEKTVSIAAMLVIGWLGALRTRHHPKASRTRGAADSRGTGGGANDDGSCPRLPPALQEPGNRLYPINAIAILVFSAVIPALVAWGAGSGDGEDFLARFVGFSFLGLMSSAAVLFGFRLLRR